MKNNLLSKQEVVSFFRNNNTGKILQCNNHVSVSESPTQTYFKEIC